MFVNPKRRWRKRIKITRSKRNHLPPLEKAAGLPERNGGECESISLLSAILDSALGTPKEISMRNIEWNAGYADENQRIKRYK